MTNEHEPDDDPLLIFRDEIRRARDELRVKLHLAAMDARAAWERFEPRLQEIEQQAHEAVAKLHAQLRRLREELAQPDAAG